MQTIKDHRGPENGNYRIALGINLILIIPKNTCTKIVNRFRKKFINELYFVVGMLNPNSKKNSLVKSC